MPAQLLLQPNPPPEPSQIPDVAFLASKRSTNDYKLSDDDREAIRTFRRAADYLSAAMIFLNAKNPLLTQKLAPEHIKSRLLGHWGTCPGLNLVYAHTTRLIRDEKAHFLFVVGPGHGAPAVLSCLWLEGSLSSFEAEYTRDLDGLTKLIANFSVPGGFPSHINAATPGAIHEGGELGYALGVSFGAALDNPDLIVTCVVGDGEAETGPTAGAWHAHKYIDPATSGAVLPILHVNGFKISERTLFGAMDDNELISLFTGYGYTPRIVGGYSAEDIDTLDDAMAAAMNWAYAEIRQIQKSYRAKGGKLILKPRWPMIILRTPKGMGSIDSLRSEVESKNAKPDPSKLGSEYIVGSYRAHQVPLPLASTDQEQLSALEAWLKSYHPEQLFEPEDTLPSLRGAPVQKILSLLPEDRSDCMGMKVGKHAALPDAADKRERINSLGKWHKLHVPDWQGLAVEKGSQQSCMKVVATLLRDVISLNPDSFRIFSPDELVSNKLDAVFQVSSRSFQWDIGSRTSAEEGIIDCKVPGRITEILSEHTCQALLQGYTLTGRTGLFPSYESFLGIVHTMMTQYSKFMKMASETPWRPPIGSLNYLETSTWTRQEHNGFSHQNPSFIGAVLDLKAQQARVYLPPDANCFLSTMAHCLRSNNYVNLMVGSKQETPVWLSAEEANRHCVAGASVWKFASVDDGVDPDVVLCGIGVEMTFEVIAAAALLRKICPALRVRVVNVTDLMILSRQGNHPHALSDESFATLFTPDRHIHFNYHGYPIELAGLLFGRGAEGRITMEGYREEGTTTSPFDMMLVNHTSRFDCAIAAVRGGAPFNPKVAVDAHQIISMLKHLAEKERAYILANGKDSDGIYDTPVFN